MRKVTICLFCVSALLCATSLKLLAHADMTAPQIVSDNFGNVVTIWMGTETACRTIQASTMPFGKSLTKPVVISDATIDSCVPVIAMNDSGNTIVLWLGRNDICGVMSAYIATLPAGGSWSAPTMISLSDETVETIVEAKLDNANKIIVGWRSLNQINHNANIVLATATFGGSWSRSEIALPRVAE